MSGCWPWEGWKVTSWAGPGRKGMSPVPFSKGLLLSCSWRWPGRSMGNLWKMVERTHVKELRLNLEATEAVFDRISVGIVAITWSAQTSELLPGVSRSAGSSMTILFFTRVQASNDPVSKMRRVGLEAPTVAPVGFRTTTSIWFTLEPSLFHEERSQ